MTLAPPGWRTTEYIHRTGIFADLPPAADVTIGTLYFATDIPSLHRSNGATWDTLYSGVQDPLIVSTVIGGVSPGSDLTLQSTNNGSPSGDEVRVKLEDDPTITCVRNPNGGGVVVITGDSALKYNTMPTNTNALEFDIDADVNFSMALSNAYSDAVAFQTYDDAVAVNIPLELRAHPIIFGAGATCYDAIYSDASPLAAGNNNDYTFTGLDLAQYIVLTADGGGSTLTGLVPTINGNYYNRKLTIINVGTGVLLIPNEDLNSAANNRFLVTNGAFASLAINLGSATFLYVATFNRWVEVR